MRKVCIVIPPLLSRRPNHHSGYSYDRDKTPHASSPETEVEYCLRRNQRSDTVRSKAMKSHWTQEGY